jgi:chorismate lyase/3-hydroxybenzoate synthase
MLPQGEHRTMSATIPSEAEVSPVDRDRLPALEPQPPQWVEDALGKSIARHARSGLHASAAGPLTLLTIAVPHARTLSAAHLRQRVSAAYLEIGARLAALQRAPIRFWNFVPDIGGPLGDGDRYMMFNAGRYDAFRSGANMAGPDLQPLATASAVGIDATDLVIHCLAAEAPGTPIENPRQKSSWQYSARYGPLPPAFTRATIAAIAGERRLLIGGTASIVGEDSRHQGNAAAQLEETLHNLAALSNAGRGGHDSDAAALRRLVDVRVYVRHDEHAAAIRTRLRAACPNAGRLELVRAQICRPELLLEIEAVADI